MSEISLQTQLSCAAMACSGIAHIAGQAGIGYLTGSVFSIINPVGGAIFGATNALTNIAADIVINAVGSNRINNVALLIAKLVISGILGAVAATFAVAAAGFPITFAAAAMLIGGIVVVDIAIEAILGCCLCVTALSAAGLGAALTPTAMHVGTNISQHRP